MSEQAKQELSGWASEQERLDYEKAQLNAQKAHAFDVMVENEWWIMGYNGKYSVMDANTDSDIGTGNSPLEAIQDAERKIIKK